MILRGKPISPGIVHGRAFFVDAKLVARAVEGKTSESPGGAFAMVALGTGNRPRERSSNPERELKRLRDAIALALSQLEQMRQQLARRVATHDAAIFETHKAVLRDPSLVGLAEQSVAAGLSAESAIEAVISQVHATFANSKASLVRDKADDILDIGRRLLRCLSTAPEFEEEFHSAMIVVASALMPSELVHFVHHGAMGAVLGSCGTKSHTAILARSLEIPVIAGLPQSLELFSDGDEIFLDGDQGLVVAPRTENGHLAAQQLLDRQAKSQPIALAQNTAPTTRDGVTLSVFLNISDPAEASAVSRLGATGIGLFRTEFLYLDREGWPSEEESYRIYQQVAQAIPQKELHLRLADFGAEKSPNYAEFPAHRNPSLGLRGIRLLLQRPDILRPQVRAIARLARERELTLLLPMVDTLDTLEKTIRELCQMVGASQRQELPFRVGAMIEVPAAALMIEDFARRTDAIAIGLNDLTQYLLAADRDDELLESYHDAMQPAVLRLMARVVEVADQYRKPVTICGELAGNPALTGLFLALGVRRLSVSRTSFSPIVRAIQDLRHDRVASLREELLRLDTADKVRQFVTRNFTITVG